jgi:RNA polymerase sigma-70 factor (ECF subfamily)
VRILTMTLDHSHAGFVTTRWTLLGRLREGDEGARRQAMEEIVLAYWPAVYAAVRRTGRGRDEAAEVTQAFFADVMIERGLLLHADTARGRLRTLILTALRNYMTDQHRRGPLGREARTIQLGDLVREEESLVAAPDESPDDAFDRRWALALVERALARCEAHYRETGKLRNWDAFVARVLDPARCGRPPVPLAALASRLGFGGAPDVAAAVQTVKRLVTTALRALVAESVEDADAGENEYRRVEELLSNLR